MRIRGRYTAMVTGLLIVIGILGPVEVASPATAKQAAAATANPPPLTTAYCERTWKIACYQAQQLERAYSLPSLYAQGWTGAGETIAVVVPFGSPTLRQDLAYYDEEEHLPAPPALNVIQPVGKVPPFTPNPTQELWLSVTDAEVELAHAIAPGASLLIAETPTNETEGVTGFPQIVAAEEYVIKHHLAGVISQAFVATEQTFTPAQLFSLRGAYQLAAKDGVTMLGPAGDTGAANVGPDGTTYYTQPVTAWPGTDPLVTSVGGTELYLDSAGNQVSAPTAWNNTYDVPLNEFLTGSAGPTPFATGGGKSIFFPRPHYQNGVASIVGDQRGVPDISMSAACDGGAEIFQSSEGSDLPARLEPGLLNEPRRRRVRRHRGANRADGRPFARTDQPIPIRNGGMPRPRHRGRHQGHEHGDLLTGRKIIYGAGLQRRTRL